MHHTFPLASTFKPLNWNSSSSAIFMHRDIFQPSLYLATNPKVHGVGMYLLDSELARKRFLS
jgi:hypothetical protein